MVRKPDGGQRYGGEEAIEVAATVTEPVAGVVKGQPEDQRHVDGLGDAVSWHGWRVRDGLTEPEGQGFERARVGMNVKLVIASLDARYKDLLAGLREAGHQAPGIQLGAEGETGEDTLGLDDFRCDQETIRDLHSRLCRSRRAEGREVRSEALT